jgi:uncharacterized phage protein gp47/JayE
MVTDLYSVLGIKEFDQMVADALQYIVNAKVGITNTNAGTVVRTLIEAIADNDDMSNYYTAYVYSALGLDEATGNDIDRLISILGITRDSATAATGVVRMSTGDEPASGDIVIPYGHIISTTQDTDGTVIEFTVSDTGKVLPSGGTYIDVNVVASIPGRIYIPAGALSVLNSSISGIETVTNINAIDSGSDAESDDELKLRTKTVSKSFGKCTDSAIKMAVEAIDGVLSCTVIDMMNGVATTGIIVATEVIPPPDGLVATINDVVKATKASGIAASVTYPSIKSIDINITITGTHDRDVVASAIVGYVNSLNIGQIFYVRQMERKVLNAIDPDSFDNDSLDISTSAPTSNQVPTSTQIIRLNSLTIDGTAYTL